MKLVERIKTAVCQWSIGQIPRPFDGLQFWRVGRERHGFNACGMSLLWRDMEARAIFDQQHMMIWARAKTGGKRGHDELIGSFRYFWDEPELTGTSFWTDEGVEIEPLVTWLNRTDRRLTGGRPDGSGDGVQSDPMFVHCPEGDVGVEPFRCAKPLRQDFDLKASLSASSPPTCRGRGRWGENPARRMNS